MEKSEIEKTETGRKEVQQMPVNFFREVGALGPNSAGFSEVCWGGIVSNGGAPLQEEQQLHLQAPFLLQH